MDRFCQFILDMKPFLSYCCDENPHDLPLIFLRIETHFYRPQTKFAKVMFSQVSVCPRGGVYPWSQRGVSATPPTLGRCPPWQTHPLGRQPLWADTPLGSACWDTHPLGNACWDTPSPSACWDTVNKQAVHIPLECILVIRSIFWQALILIVCGNCLPPIDQLFQNEILSVSVLKQFFFVNLWSGDISRIFCPLRNKSEATHLSFL